MRSAPGPGCRAPLRGRLAVGTNRETSRVPQSMQPAPHWADGRAASTSTVNASAAKGDRVNSLKDTVGSKRRGWLVLVAVLGGLLMATLIGGCNDSSGSAVTSPTTSAAADAPNTITVVGKATISSTPDEAVLTLTVESDGADPGAAMNANSAAVTKVLERLKSEGVESATIQTSNVTVYPNRTYNPQTGEETLAGYRSQNAIQVTLKDSGKLGGILAAALEAGVNYVSGPTWKLSDDSPVTVEALKQAVANARTKAEALASAQGVKVGEVITMREGTVDQSYPPLYTDMAYTPYAAESRALAGGVADTPISAGTMDVTATVTVTYVLSR
jgi:uncharacterized protein YggE